MSLLISGMDMPKQTEVQTDKGTLKLWTIRNWKVGQDVQFGAAKIPCDLSFNHDGTIHLSVLGRKYSLTDVPTPHGDLIDRDKILKKLQRLCKHCCKGVCPEYCPSLQAINDIKSAKTVFESEE